MDNVLGFCTFNKVLLECPTFNAQAKMYVVSSFKDSTRFNIFFSVLKYIFFISHIEKNGCFYYNFTLTSILCNSVFPHENGSRRLI